MMGAVTSSNVGTSAVQGMCALHPEARIAFHFERLCREAAEHCQSPAEIKADIPKYEALARMFVANEQVEFWQRQLRMERDRADTIINAGNPFAQGKYQDG